MNVPKLIALLVCLMVSVASADPNFTLKAIRLDGLTPQLTDLKAELGKTPEDTMTDLSPAFRKLGIPIPEGGSVQYKAGALICRLEDIGHATVLTATDSLYQKDDVIATYRAYHELLGPLSSQERFRTVQRIGFMPDPLVASMIREFQELRIILRKPTNDPRQAAAEEQFQKRYANLEKETTDLLDASLGKLKEQLAALDAAERK